MAFQYFRYATLGNDLMFFFYACTDQRLRELHWDTFLHEYHKTFTDTLSALGSDKNLLTMDALKADIKQKAVFGIGMAIEAVTMSLLEDDEVADTDSIQVNVRNVIGDGDECNFLFVFRAIRLSL